MRNYFIAIPIVLSSCNLSNEGPSKAQEIINKTIEQGGGDAYNKAIIDFDFREFHYRSERDGGIYSFHRIKQDSTVEVHDILNNEGFQRWINGRPVDVLDSMAEKYASSINSVIYFALLPYGLNDAAVNKKLLGETEINGGEYYKIKVTFDEDGGGEDHEDVFIYWISKENYTIDYLAYQFFTDGGGYRFRKAQNARVINGIRFVDYINYKPLEEKIEIEQIDSLYKNNALEWLSEINLENINVVLNKD